jgi:RNA polymerase sigma-70 factor, ECF subfamily
VHSGYVERRRTVFRAEDALETGPKSGRNSTEGSPLVDVTRIPRDTLRLVSDTACTERELIARIRAGDVGSFERVFRDFYGPLCDVVNGYLKAPDMAEEVVQDLLLAVWNQRTQIDLRDSLRVYLFKAARNRALNCVRRVRREIAWTRDALLTPTPPTPQSDTQQRAECNELASAVAEAVTALPERRRLAFQLTQQVGLSHAETAAVMGIAAKTVAIHLGLARQELRMRLAAFIDR